MATTTNPAPKKAATAKKVASAKRKPAAKRAASKKPAPAKKAPAKEAVPAQKTSKKPVSAVAKAPAKRSGPSPVETPVRGALQVTDDGKLYIVDKDRKRRFLDELAGKQAPELELFVKLSKDVLERPLTGDESTKVIDALRTFLYDRALGNIVGKVRCCTGGG